MAAKKISRIWAVTPLNLRGGGGGELPRDREGSCGGSAGETRVGGDAHGA